MTEHNNIWAKLVEDSPLKERILREVQYSRKLRIELEEQEKKVDQLKKRASALEYKAPFVKTIDFENSVTGLPSDKTNPEYSAKWNALKVEIAAYAAIKEQFNAVNTEYKKEKRVLKALSINNFEQDKLLGMLMLLGDIEQIEFTEAEIQSLTQ